MLQGGDSSPQTSSTRPSKLHVQRKEVAGDIPDKDTELQTNERADANIGTTLDTEVNDNLTDQFGEPQIDITYIHPQSNEHEEANIETTLDQSQNLSSQPTSSIQMNTTEWSTLRFGSPDKLTSTNAYSRRQHPTRQYIPGLVQQPLNATTVIDVSFCFYLIS